MSEPALPAAAARSDAIRYGAYMLRRFGWFYHAIGLGWALSRVRLEDHSAERIRAAAERGPVVYVLLDRSPLDHLALNTVLNRRRLPLSVWADRVTAFYWQPVVEAWADVLRRVRKVFSRGRAPHPVESGWLARTVAQGAPVVLFVHAAEEGRADPFAAVLEAQELTSRPIQILPVIVVWNRAPLVRGGAVEAFIRGGAVGPSFLSRLRALLPGAETILQVGEAVDLTEVRERVVEGDRAKALRVLLRRFLKRESRLVRGPTLLPYRDMERVVLDNPPMRDLAAREAQASGRTPDAIRRDMHRDYRRIAAHFRWWIVRLLELVLRPLWTRVFDGVDIGDRDIDRIRQAMRGGAAVLVPSHKSHFDYVLLSWVFYRNDLVVPHIVAGENLAIWPVSILMRSAGGFFIKRSFSGERVFPAVFSRYMRELLRLGYPVEFFIEGGRTRSGKLMPPRLGVLGMVLDAASVRSPSHEITFLPISFAYEEVAEAGVYARELSGEKKQPETLGQVVKAGKVLGNRYGKAYVRVGEPLKASAFVDRRADRPGWDDLDRADRKEILQEAGERLVYRIGRATVVLPTSLVALAVLAHHRRGLRNAELIARCERFRAFLGRCQAEEAGSLRLWSQALAQALARLHGAGLLEALEDGGERVWAVPPDKRITLEFYKNQVLHYFATAGYVAIAVRARPEGPFTANDLRATFADLAWLFRREFVLDPDRSVTAQVEEGIAALAAHGAIAAVGDGAWDVSDAPRMGEIHALFRPFVEAYALVLGNVHRFVPKHSDRRALLAALQGDRDQWLASGAVTRPEALSLVTLENAVQVCEEDGVIVNPDDAGWAVDEGRRAERTGALGAILGGR